MFGVVLVFGVFGLATPALALVAFARLRFQGLWGGGGFRV